MSKTPAGGAATVGGVVYQLLWSLLELTRYEVRQVQQNDAGVLTSAVLVLEPTGGGGDARVETIDRYVVVQLKTRSDGGTWSLQEVITNVFPDLIRAVRLEAVNPSYQFVTDGRIGKWSEVQGLFQSFRGLNEQEIARIVESPATFRVGTRSGSTRGDRTPFWTKQDYSAGELVNKIVETIRARIKTDAQPPNLERRVLHLLAHFDFTEGLTVDDAENRIDKALREKIDYLEDIQDTRLCLLQRLAEFARTGNKSIELGTFLTDAGLGALPTSQVSRIVARSRKILERRLVHLRFRSENHVQVRFTEHLLSQIEKHPIVAVTGESGSGKSWHCCAVARLLAEQGALVAHVDASNDAQTTLDRAMGVLWNEAKGHDRPLSWQCAVRRMPESPPLRVLIIDRVEDRILARDLAVAGCDSDDLRLVLGCSREAAEAVKTTNREQCSLTCVSSFTPTELNDYLTARHVSRWEATPADVRLVLQAPLLANLYCDSLKDNIWHPPNEYDLFNRYWHTQLGLNAGRDAMLDTALLKEIARAFLAGEPYPFDDDQMGRLVKHEQSFSRLRKSGILALRTDGSCEVWHDRILNWLVSWTLVEDLVAKKHTQNDIAALCGDAASFKLRPSGKNLGHVPMDALWQLALRGEIAAATSVLAELEADGGWTNLYTESVPTLGTCVVPVLLQRLDQLLADDASYTTTEVANCLARIESTEAIEKARSLLVGTSAEGRSVALNILSRQGDPEALEDIWCLHIEALADETRGVDYKMRMDALAAGIRRQPQWLIDSLRRAGRTTPGLTDLVYQLARLDNGADFWSDLKQHLKAIVPTSRKRSIMRCISAFRDIDEVGYLRTEADNHEDFSGDMALAALTRLAPETAAADLARSKLPLVTFTRGWHFLPLLAAQPKLAQKAARELVTRRAEPWALCDLYGSAVNQIDVAGFEIILDHLVATLRAELASGAPDANSGPLYRPLAFIDGIVKHDLIACLRARKGRELPQLLGEYLLAIGPRDNMSARLTDRQALRALQRIGDPILTRWVIQGLRASTQYGRLDALHEAHKHADAEVGTLLHAIALRSDCQNDRFESHLAVHALTQIEAWESVLEATLASDLSISPYPFESRRGAPPLNGDYVESLLSRTRIEAATPGMLLAAGLTRDPRFTEFVMSSIERGNEPPNILVSAAIAAELLEIQDDVAVQRIACRLNAETVPSRLPGLVLQLGTPSALDAVEAYIKRHFDSVLCVALADKDGWEDRAANLAWDHLDDAERSPAFGLILTLLPRVKGNEVRMYLEKLAFGYGHNLIGRSYRLEAVQGLSAIDRNRAYEAALGAARDPSEKARVGFPKLLVELDEDRAVPRLLELIRSGDTEDIELAVADAVSGCNISNQIEAMLQSEDASERRAGCILAGRRSMRNSTTRLLRERSVDLDETVARAAMAALLEDLRARGVRDLAEEAAREKGEKRWIAIDHAIAAARGSKNTPGVRRDALSPLDRKLSALEEKTAEKSLREGERDYRAGVAARARRPRE